MNSGAYQIALSENDIISLSDDIPSDDLNAEDDLFTFPFDHIYACSSQPVTATKVVHNQQVRQTVNEVNQGTSSSFTNSYIDYNTEIKLVYDKLTKTRKENRYMRELTITHIDLIQSQSDTLKNKDKHITNLKKEIAELHATIARLEKKPAVVRASVNTSKLVKFPPVPFDKALNPNANLPLVNSTITKSQSAFATPPSIAAHYPNLQAYQESDFSGQINIPPVTTVVTTRYYTPNPTPTPKQLNPIIPQTHTETGNDNLNFVIPKMPVPRSSLSLNKNGTVTSTSSYSKSRYLNKPQESCSRFSRETKTATVTSEPTRKPNMIRTELVPCSLSPTQSLSMQSKFSSSGRFQLIENTTPEGGDPYQLGEADLRDTSPIPKLSHSKSPSKHKILNDLYFDQLLKSDDNIESDVNKKLEEEEQKRIKQEKPVVADIFDDKNSVAPSLRDFSYGDNANNVAANILPHIRNKSVKKLEKKESDEDYVPAKKKRKVCNRKTKRRVTTTKSRVRTKKVKTEPNCKNQKGKRATAASKKEEKKKKPEIGKPPSMTVNDMYFTHLGEPSPIWVVHLDPELESEDLNPGGTLNTTKSLEVPRWREKPYTKSCVKPEGVEESADHILTKIHNKFELEERRRQRWDIQQIREQRNVERLKRRQRDTWYLGPETTATQEKTRDSFWPNPRRDARLILVTSDLPAAAFGEIIPQISETNSETYRRVNVAASR